MNEVIKRAKHLTTQIESILICARGTTQHIILQRTKINIEEVIKTAIGNICVDLSSKPHSIEIVNESPNIRVFSRSTLHRECHKEPNRKCLLK